MSHFRPIGHHAPYLLLASISEWRPADHLARCVVKVVEQLELSVLTGQYRGSGSAAFHPAMLLAQLRDGYANGTGSRRHLERVTYDSPTFRYLAASTRPDRDTLRGFRERFRREIQSRVVPVLRIAPQVKGLKRGKVARDRTTLHASASRHSALCYGHAQKLEVRLQSSREVPHREGRAVSFYREKTEES